MHYMIMITTGALIGWGTNKIAIWLLFHPHNPVHLGFWQWQGLLPRHRRDIARSVGVVVERELLKTSDLERILDNPSVRRQVLVTLSALVQEQMAYHIPKYVPKTITGYFAKRFNVWAENKGAEFISDVIKNIATQLGQADFSSLIEDRLNSLSLAELETLTWDITGKELRYIEYAGGVLGGVIGLLQAVVWSSLF